MEKLLVQSGNLIGRTGSPSTYRHAVYSILNMESKYFEDKQVVLSQSEFIRELTSSDTEQENSLGKRPFAQNLDLEIPALKKLVVFEKALTEEQTKPRVFQQAFPAGLEGISSVTSPTSSLEHVDYETIASTLGSISAEDRQLQLLMRDQFECHKVLLKHFLLETITNEKLNLARYNILPEICQKLALLFLRTHFNFDLEKEVRSGSHKKYLYGLHGRQYCSVSGTSVSLSFVTDCYLYGLKKQLKSGGKNLDQSQIIETLHKALFQSADALHFTTFHRTIERLLRYESGKAEDSSTAILSNPLLLKLSQISEKTLRKFYSFKLHRSLSSLIDDAKSVAELKKNFSCRKQTIDILSAYIGMELDTPRLYRISVLQVKAANTSI